MEDGDEDVFSKFDDDASTSSSSVFIWDGMSISDEEEEEDEVDDVVDVVSI